MKGSKVYIVCIVLFLAIMFVIEYNTPKKFVWVPTFSHKDHQPFGAAVFDDIVSKSMPDYRISFKTIYQLAQDSLQNTGLLIVAQRLNLIDVEVNTILDLAAKGNKIMLVSPGMNFAIRDTLGFGQSYDYFSIVAMREHANTRPDRDSIIWEEDSLYSRRVFRAYPHLLRSYFTKPDSNFIVLARKDYTHFPPVAMVKKVGKGEIIVVSTSLLFTNYGMLDADNSDYIFRLLSRFKGMTVIRTEAYTGMSEELQSPLRYFLSQAPLRWALYLGVITLLLFMIFTARRKQRAIPVVKAPENRSVEFVQLIGTLYYQKKGNVDLVQKKMLYFSEILRRTIQADIDDESDDQSLVGRISQKTGMDETKIQRLINELRPVKRGEVEINDTQMKNYIDRMNEIINNL